MRLAPEEWLAQTKRGDRSLVTKLLSPLGVEEFLATHWLRQPAVLRADHAKRRLSALPDDRDLWALLAREPSLAAKASVVSEGKGARAVHTAQTLRRRYRRERASVVVHGLDAACALVGRASRALGGVFRAPTFANAYLTPGDAWAFPIHWDCHEALVFQVAGKKSWSLYAPVLTDPLEHLHDSRAYRFRAGRPTMQVELEAGDFLYIPRGVPHRAACREEPSAHLTFAVTLPTWHDVVLEATRRALAELGDDAAARAFAPVRLPLAAPDRRRTDARIRSLCASVSRAVARQARVSWSSR